MKKLLAALFILCSLLFMPAALAEVETYTGEGKATMSEAETLEKVIERAKTYALRNAREKAGVYIRSQSRLRDLELVEDEVVTLTSGILKIKDSKVEKTLVNDAIQVYVIVTVTIDSDDLQREIDKFLSQNPNRKTTPQQPPVEQPKPVEKVEVPNFATPLISDFEKVYDIEVNGKLTQPTEYNNTRFFAKAVLCEGIVYIPVVPIAKTLLMKIDWNRNESTLKSNFGKVICYELKNQPYCNGDDVMILFNIEGSLQTGKHGIKVFRFKTSKSKK